MAECVVVADDLTGANATGVLLTKMNYRATTVMNLDTVSTSTLSDCDCILYPTDSRGTDAKSAYDAVYEATLRELTAHCAATSEARRTRCWTAWEMIISRSWLPAFPHPAGS